MISTHKLGTMKCLPMSDRNTCNRRTWVRILLNGGGGPPPPKFLGSWRAFVVTFAGLPAVSYSQYYALVVLVYDSKRFQKPDTCLSKPYSYVLDMVYIQNSAFIVVLPECMKPNCHL